MKAKLGALALLMSAALQAGHPNKCNDGQGPPCGKASCAAIDKNGNLTGVYCAPKKCTRTCCGCVAKCNGHPHEPNPEEESLAAGLQSGRVD